MECLHLYLVSKIENQLKYVNSAFYMAQFERFSNMVRVRQHQKIIICILLLTGCRILKNIHKKKLRPLFFLFIKQENLHV